MAFMTFHILGIVIPTDKLIFFRGVGQPPTSINFGFPKVLYSINMYQLFLVVPAIL